MGRVFAEHVLDLYTPDGLAGWIADPVQAVVVADGAAGPVGYGRLDRAARDETGALEVATLYVQLRHHGRGLGGALLSRLEAEGTWLSINVENAPALRFYAARGYAVVGRRDYVIEGTGYENAVLRRAGA